MRLYEPALPTFYNRNRENEKVCLTYFVTILHSKRDLEILNINILSMPNGELEKYYKERVLSAGKLKDEARFNFQNVNRFELLKDTPSRIRVVYFKKDMKREFKKRLKIFEELL